MDFSELSVGQLQRKLEKSYLSQTNRYEVYVQLAIKTKDLTDHKLSIKYLKQLLQNFSNSQKNSFEKKEIFKMFCYNYRKLNQFSKSIQYGQLYLKLEEETQNMIGIQKAYCELGLTYSDYAEFLQENYKDIDQFNKIVQLGLQHLNMAQTFSKKLVETYKKDQKLVHQFQRVLAEALYNKANMKYIQGQNDRDINVKAIQELKEQNISNIYQSKNSKNISENFNPRNCNSPIYPINNNINRCSKFSKQIKYSILEGKCYSTLGLIYFNEQDFQNAINCFQTDCDICEKEQDFEGLIHSLRNLARAQKDNRNFKHSKQNYSKALKLSQQYQFVSMEEAINQEDIPDLEDTIFIYNETVQLEQGIEKQNKYINWENLVKISNNYESLKIYGKNITLIQKYLNEKNISQKIQMQLTLNLAYCYKAQKQFKLALDYFRQINALKGIDSIEQIPVLINIADCLDEIMIKNKDKSFFEEIEKTYWKAFDLSLDKQLWDYMKNALNNLEIMYEREKIKEKLKTIKNLRQKYLANMEIEEETQNFNCSSDEFDIDENQSEEDEDPDDDCRSQLSKFSTTISGSNNEYDGERGQNKREKEVQVKLNKQQKLEKEKFLVNDGKRKENQSNKENLKNNNNMEIEPQIRMIEKKVGQERVELAQKYKQKCQKQIVEENQEILRIFIDFTKNSQYFSFQNYYLCDQDIIPVFKAIKYVDSHQLIELNFKNNNMTNQILSKLTKILPSNLKNLNLSNNKFELNSEFLTFLERKSSILEILSIKNCKVIQDNENCDIQKRFWEIIEQSGQLKEINIKNCNLSAIYLQEIEQPLKNVKSLKISQNNLFHEENLALLYKKFPDLVYLDLSQQYLKQQQKQTQFQENFTEIPYISNLKIQNQNFSSFKRVFQKIGLNCQFLEINGDNQTQGNTFQILVEPILYSLENGKQMKANIKNLSVKDLDFSTNQEIFINFGNFTSYLQDLEEFKLQKCILNDLQLYDFTQIIKNFCKNLKILLILDCKINQKQLEIIKQFESEYNNFKQLNLILSIL